MLPTTIDGVIERLEGIIRECSQRQDRLGYFAALYNRVTKAVREGIRKGEFDDGPRMERLDVEFANRYLAAYDQFRAGELPSGAWVAAFRAAQDPHHIVLQHLLVGMNAHINLDLGIAAARTCPGVALPGLKRDFDRINQVLASLTPVVEQEIDRCSPVFDALTRIAPKLELTLVGFSMEKARDAAWTLARELAPLGRQEQVIPMSRRDGESLLVAAAVLNDGLLVKLIRAHESTDVAHNVAILSQGEFRVAVPALVPQPG